MDAGYRGVLALPAARRLLAAITLAWLGFGMVVLAVFLAAERASGSAVIAGLAVAAQAVGAAALAPFRGRLLDRRGPRPWLAVFAAVHGTALVLLALAARAGSTDVVVIGLAGLAGLAAPPLIATLRQEWAVVLPEHRLRRGYALTSLIGDAGLVAGPVLAGALFTVVAWLPLVLAAVFVLAGALVARGGPPPTPDAGDRPRLAGRDFTTLLCVSVGLGVAVGIVEVSVPTAALGWEVAAWAGVMLAAFAAGSILGGLWFGRRDRGGTSLRRYLLATAVLAALIAPLAAAVGPVSLGLLLLVAGLGYGPATIALFEALDAVAPARATEAFTWITTAEAAGSAGGAAAAGWIVTHRGLPEAFTTGAVVLAAAAAWGLARTREP